MKTKTASGTATRAKSNGTKSTNGAQSKSKSEGGEKDNMLEEFFKDEVKDIYWAEKHLVKTLPKMAKAATSPELKEAFTNHLEEKAQAKKCDAMEGITKEGDGVIEDTETGTSTRDVGLILSGQKVEHYEIATYGGLAQLARNLSLNEIAELLETTLEEEKTADETLTTIAEDSVNYDAA